MANVILKNLLDKIYCDSSIKLKLFQSLKKHHITDTYLNYSSCRPQRQHKKKRPRKILTKKSMNQQITQMQFAVKGAVLLRALKHKADMAKGIRKEFSDLIYTNQGDAHAMGQPAITFLRQVLATCVYPELFNFSSIPEDVKERARIILEDCKHASMGAYTDSQGMSVVRQHLAEYIAKRDYGIEAKPANIFITDGASPVIKNVLSLFCKDVLGKPAGIMLPIPLYPLYTAVMTELKLYPVNYYLDEDKNWGLDMKEISRALQESKTHCNAKAIVVINPGNPTGQVLSRKQIENLIKFAYEEKLVILADEVYQENVYDETSDFYSFKRVKHELGPPYNKTELASFISVSKGYTGECGIRGGCAELDGFDKDVQDMAIKLSTVSLNSNTVGQAALSVIAKPPEPGDQSYDEFFREKCCILNGLAAKGTLVTSQINKIPGLKVNPVQGALYAMVKIDMPDNAIKAARSRGLVPDVMWCYDLLDSTGIVVVPGSGFGQKPGTWHFRTTILPPFETMEKVMKGIKKFQKSFLKRYKS